MSPGLQSGSGSRYEAVVMGGSAGGFRAFVAILAALPADFRLPLLLVLHLRPDDDDSFARHLAALTRRPVNEARDKERMQSGHVYVAPANYHLLLERGGTLALSIDEKINWSRPSIDVLFESAATALGGQTIAVICSGASVDGAAGIRAIKAAGGMTIAQHPATAEYPFMPRAAIDTGEIDEILTVDEISRRLTELDSEAK